MNDYKSILLDQYHQHREKKNIFTMRGFSNLIGISPQHFSMLLKGKVGISQQKAEDIAKTLGLTGDIKNLFVASAASKHSRGQAIKKIYSQELKTLQKKNRLELILKNLELALIILNQAPNEKDTVNLKINFKEIETALTASEIQLIQKKIKSDR